MKKILIYRLGSLGDTLLALPCFHAIRAKFPKAHICLLTNLQTSNKTARMIDILDQIGVVDEVLEYPLGSRNVSAMFSLTCDLRRRNLDMAVHLAAPRGWKASIRDFAFLKLAGAKKVVGVPFATQDLYSREVGEGIWEWEAERLIRRIQPLVSVDLLDPVVWDLGLTIEEESEAARLLARKEFPERRWIVASVGTKSDVKDWTQSNWLALVKSLRADFSEIGWAMIGSKADFERSEYCLAEWLGPRLNLCGRIAPRISAAVLKQAELFVGHDSGPMHLAAVVETPCVAIFAARNFPGQWFPRGRNQIFYRRTECFGCGLETCVDHGKKCILEITVPEVKSAIQRILQEKGSAAIMDQG